MQKGFVYDDPFILMRYGQHLANGAGWNFNPSSATTNAATSPLYVLLIAAGTLIGGSPEAWSNCIYTGAWGLGGIILARILFHDGRRLGAWLACVLYSISPLLANVRGMETSLYLLLILTAIWAFQRERWLLLGCLLGLMAMARSDAVVLAAALTAWLGLRRSRTVVLTVLGPFVAITASWTFVLWAMTGSPFPSTLAAKIAQRDSGAGAPNGASCWGLTANGIMGTGKIASLGRVFVLGPAGLGMLVVAVFGTVVTFRRRERALPALTAVAAIVLLEYGVALRMPSGYLWHYGPWTLWAIAGAAVGLEEAVRRRHRVAASIAVAIALTGSVFAVDLGPDGIRSHYLEVAEWIDRDTHSPHPTVASREIGVIGYYGRADMIDYLGLLDARAIDSIRRGDFTWWLSNKPDYWVTPGIWIDVPTLALPQFQREYKPAATFGPLTVYRRSAP
jgi:hypothetical protein